MFTIEANVDETYEVMASAAALQRFFAEPENFVRYMPEIIDQIEPGKQNRATWHLKIEIPSASAIKVAFELEGAPAGQNMISYEPIAATPDRLAIYIKLFPNGNQTEVNFRLELRLQRKSSFDIHPLAGLMGERAISKLVLKHSQDLVGEFVAAAEKQAKKKK